MQQRKRRKNLNNLQERDLEEDHILFFNVLNLVRLDVTLLPSFIILVKDP